MTASLGAESERWCIVLVVVERDSSVVLVVEPTRVAVPCPRCGELSRRQHSRDERHPLDLPWRGQTVRMRVHSRRWFCDTQHARGRSSRSASTVHWRAMRGGPTPPPIC